MQCFTWFPFWFIFPIFGLLWVLCWGIWWRPWRKTYYFTDHPIVTAAHRYAAGEITKTEFEQLLKDLQNTKR